MTLDLTLMSGTFFVKLLLVSPYLALIDETIHQTKMRWQQLVPPIGIISIWYS